MNLDSVDSDVSDDGDNEFIVHAKKQACSIHLKIKGVLTGIILDFWATCSP